MPEDIKITELPKTETLGPEDEYPLVQGGTTKKIGMRDSIVKMLDVELTDGTLPSSGGATTLKGALEELYQASQNAFIKISAPGGAIPSADFAGQILIKRGQNDNFPDEVYASVANQSGTGYIAIPVKYGSEYVYYQDGGTEKKLSEFLANETPVFRKAAADTDKNTSNIGDISTLQTVQKDNLVNAINGLNTKIVDHNTKINSNSTQILGLQGSVGDVNNLATTAKDNLVNAINEALQLNVSKFGDVNVSIVDSKARLTFYDRTGDGQVQVKVVEIPMTTATDIIDDNSELPTKTWSAQTISSMNRSVESIVSAVGELNDMPTNSHIIADAITEVATDVESSKAEISTLKSDKFDGATISGNTISFKSGNVVKATVDVPQLDISSFINDSESNTTTAWSGDKTAKSIAVTDNKIGILSSLNTQNKSNIVESTNEINAKVDSCVSKIGDTSGLETTAKELISAINELNTKSGDLLNLSTTTKSSLVSSINELYTKVNTDVASKIQTLEDKVITNTSDIEINKQTVAEHESKISQNTTGILANTSGISTNTNSINDIKSQLTTMEGNITNANTTAEDARTIANEAKSKAESMEANVDRSFVGATHSGTGSNEKITFTRNDNSTFELSMKTTAVVATVAPTSSNAAAFDGQMYLHRKNNGATAAFDVYFGHLSGATTYWVKLN